MLACCYRVVIELLLCCYCVVIVLLSCCYCGVIVVLPWRRGVVMMCAPSGVRVRSHG